MNFKLLGLEIDEELSFSEHVDTVCKKVSQRIHGLNLLLKQRLLYYTTLIRLVIKHASFIWTNYGKEGLGGVLKLQKQAARVNLKVHRQAPSVHLVLMLSF